MFILCQGINSVDKLQKILFQRVYIFTRLVLGAQKKKILNEPNSQQISLKLMIISGGNVRVSFKGALLVNIF